MIPRPVSSQQIPSNAELVFKGNLFDIYQWKQEMYDGTYKVFEKVRRPDTVIIIPVTEEKKIVLIEEIQPGKQSSLSTPGGRLEESEEAEEAAKRELQEETGYKTEQMVLLEAFQPVNKIDWAVYIFIAKSVKKVSEQNLDGGERVRVIEVSFEEFLTIASDKKYNDDKEVRLKVLEALTNEEEMQRLKQMILEWLLKSIGD